MVVETKLLAMQSLCSLKINEKKNLVIYCASVELITLPEQI